MNRIFTFSCLCIWVSLANHCASAQDLSLSVPGVTCFTSGATGGPVALSSDTTRLKFGNVKVIIIEEPDSKDPDSSSSHKPEKLRFDEDCGTKFNNWAGFYLGVNGFLTYDNQLTLDPAYRNFELDYSRSITAGMNFGDLHVSIIPNYLGLSTGVGIQWNRYAWKNNTELVTTSDTIYGVENTTYDYSKNILKATYIQVPLLIDINTNSNENKAFHFSAGIVGGYKLGSKIKQRYKLNDEEFDNKSKGHFHLSPFQAYLTAQVGYGEGALFVNYGLTRIFEKGKGPQLYPFTAGFKFLF